MRRGPSWIGVRPCEYRMHYSRTAETGCTTPHRRERLCISADEENCIYQTDRPTGDSAFRFAPADNPIGPRRCRNRRQGNFRPRFSFSRGTRTHTALFINSHAVYRALNRVAGWALIDLENRRGITFHFEKSKNIGRFVRGREKIAIE